MRTLLRYYQVLEGELKQAFEKRLYSPIYHSDLKKQYPLIPLYEALGELTLSADQKANDKALFEKSYPNKEYDKEKFAKAHYQLCQLMEDFLVFKEIEADKNLKEQAHFAMMYRYKLGSDFFSDYRQFSKEEEDKKNHDARNYQKDAAIEELHLRYFVDENNVYPQNPNKVNVAFSYYVLIENLRLACITYDTKTKIEDNTFAILQSQLIDYVVNMKNELPLELQIYLACYQMKSKENGEKYYKELKTLLLKNVLVEKEGKKDGEKESEIVRSIHCLSSLALHDLIEIIVNFCTALANQGKQDYYTEVFFWYEKGLDFGFLIQNGYIRFRTFRKIVTDFTRLKKYDEALDFIEKNKVTLEKVYQDDYVFYLKAMVLFAQGNYEAMRPFLSKKTPDAYKEDAISLNYYLFSSIIYLDDADLHSRNHNNFSNYLRRKESEIKNIENYRNLLKYSQKLSKLISDKSKRAAFEKLKEKITNEGKLSAKTQLLSELNRYKTQVFPSNT